MVDLKKSAKPFVLSDTEFEQIMQKLQCVSQKRFERNRRKYARHAYIAKDINVKISQPAGGAIERNLTVVDLSASGASMLYPGYLHSGSVVQMALRKRAGMEETVHGRVVTCRHVQGAWHAVGIKFDDVIYPMLFLQTSRNEMEEVEDVRVDISRLKGSVLLVDDQPMDRMLFGHLMQGSNLRITEVETADEALALIVRSLTDEKSAQPGGAFDLVVSDLKVGEASAEQTIKNMREKGYHGPLIVMTAETTQSRLTSVLNAGATAILQKPYTADRLHSVVAGELGEAGRIIEEPLFSQLVSNPQNQQMVEKYVNYVRLKAADLRKAIKADELENSRAICLQLKGTGAGYGFAVLTDAAAAAVKSLDASCSVAESVTDLYRLDAICARLSGTKPATATASRN